MMKHSKWRFVVFCWYCGVVYAQHSAANITNSKLLFRADRDVIVVVNEKRHFIKGDGLRYVIFPSSEVISVTLQQLNGRNLKKWPKIYLSNKFTGVYFDGYHQSGWKATYLSSLVSHTKCVVLTKKRSNLREVTPKSLPVKATYRTVDLPKKKQSFEKAQPLVAILSVGCPADDIKDALEEIDQKAYKKAFDRLKNYPMAILKNAKVLSSLGYVYSKYEYGIPLSMNKAADYYLEAAKLDDSAEVNWALANLYLQQPQMATEALDFLKKGDEKGYPRAALELGRIYFNGTYHVPKDEAKGVSLIEKAAVNGLTEAQYQLGKIYSKGSETITKDLKKAKYWYAKVANH